MAPHPEREMVFGTQPIRDVQIVRKVNRGTVLELLRRKGPLSRTAIARAVRLTPPTCFSIIDELVASGLAHCTETARSAPGRPRAIFEFNPSAAFSLGVDLSYASFVGVLTNLSGEVLEERWQPRPDPPDVDRVAEWISAFVKDVSRSPRLDPAKLLGIGVSTPALLDAGLERVLRSTNLNWRDVPLASRLAEALGIEVHLENNARAIALAERWFGVGQDVQHLACINIGMGISMGLIVNGMLHRGVSIHSGELGHTIVDPTGLPCRCGRHGCLEMVASGRAILHTVAEAIRQGRSSTLLAAADGNPAHITIDMVTRAADEGDPLARETVLAAATKTGYALSNALVLLDTGMVVLSGSLIHSSHLTFDTVVDIVRRTVLTSPNRTEELPVVRARLGQLAGAIGAAGIVHQRRMALYDAVRVVH
ncbi:MAG: ROK family transcriptional regulator [candidate division NC10 bacterium]|nr:ROK family transcriptional regulator [candidate division NC10 bacterium]